MHNDIDTARELDAVFAMTCKALRKMGRGQIALSREWFSISDNRAAEYRIQVPIGRDLALPIFGSYQSGEDRMGYASRFAAELALALVNVEAARWSLRRYAGAMRRAAAASIDRSVELGIELTLEGVAFKETRAFHLTHRDWREASFHVLAEVRVTGLDYQLLPATQHLIIEELEDVEGEIRALHEEQLDYQAARDAIRQRGADIAVDEMTLRHLDRYGINRLEALRMVAAEGGTIFPIVTREGLPGHLSLTSDAGTIRCHPLDRGDFVWLRDVLILEGAHPPAEPHAFVGHPVSTVCPDEIYEGLVLGEVEARARCPEYKVIQPIHLVDLAAGRFWPLAA